MAECKTPILLRRGPVSGIIQAVYAYTERDGIIRASGKQSVQSDFDNLMLEELLADDAPNLVGILDGVAGGETLNDEERAEVRAFRERLKTAILRCNEANEKARANAPEGAEHGA